MSSLSMVEAKLPPGFRFHPRDDELVCDYLLPKWNACDSSLLTVVDLNKSEPWDIPERACIGGKEWYFYSQRDRKYATGLRTNRATVSGYWKATGKDRAVVRRGSLVGMRKTLVFYQGRAPKGRKTEWVMHEFRVEGPFGPPKLTSPSKEDWVLCRVFFKNKDTPAKSGTENDSNNSIDEATDSSSVAAPPPLIDSYITFDQPHSQPHANANVDAYQQVPCFSMFSANQNNIDNNNNPNPNPNPNPTNNIVYPQNNENEEEEEGLAMPIGNSSLNPITCDKRVLEAVLRNLTKMETCPTLNASPGLGLGSGLGAEAPTSETYLSQLALQHQHPHPHPHTHPTMWTHF